MLFRSPTKVDSLGSNLADLLIYRAGRLTDLVSGFRKNAVIGSGTSIDKTKQQTIMQIGRTFIIADKPGRNFNVKPDLIRLC